MDHSVCLREGQTAVRIRGQIWAEEALTAALEGALVVLAQGLQRAAKTGSWLTGMPSTVNGADMGVQEWRDALFLRYGLGAPDLPTHCDGC